MHFLEKCKHGLVMRQCRCPGPKAVRIVPCDHPDEEKGPSTESFGGE